MGFGFVVARFGLFAYERGKSIDAYTSSITISAWIGISLVVLGVLINLAAAMEHRCFLRRLSQQHPDPPSRISLSLVAAVSLSVVGLMLAVHLVVSGR